MAKEQEQQQDQDQEPNTEFRDIINAGILSRQERHARLKHWVLTQPDEYEHMSGCPPELQTAAGEDLYPIWAEMERIKRLYIYDLECQEARLDRGVWEPGRQYRFEHGQRPRGVWFNIARYVYDPEMNQVLYDLERDIDLRP